MTKKERIEKLEREIAALKAETQVEIPEWGRIIVSDGKRYVVTAQLIKPYADDTITKAQLEERLRTFPCASGDGKVYGDCGTSMDSCIWLFNRSTTEELDRAMSHFFPKD